MKNNIIYTLIILIALLPYNLLADNNKDDLLTQNKSEKQKVFKLQSIDKNKYSSNSKVLTSNEYLLAKSQYKIGNYQNSYKRFYKLFLKYTDSVEINYYLAMSAQKLKQYDEATAAFERVLIVKPEFNRARLEYARVLFLLGFKEEAKKEFLIVAASPIPENVRKNIKKYIDEIEGNTVSSTFMSLSFGLSYDDNINSGLDYTTYSLPGFGNMNVTGEEPQSSSSHISTFQINHIHSLGKNSPLIVKHTGFIYNKKQTKNNKYDFQFMSYKPTIYYNDPTNKSEYSLQLGLEKVLPGDNTDFFTYSAAPHFKKLINKDNIFTTFARYQEIHYMKDSDKNKSYSKKGLGLSWKYKKLKYLVNIEEDIKSMNGRNDIDKKIIEQIVSFDYDIQPKLILFLQYKYRQIQYKDHDSFFDGKRKDTNKNIYLGLTRIMNKKDFLTLSYSNTDNVSNQSAYVYDRDTFNLNYTWRFKF